MAQSLQVNQPVTGGRTRAVSRCAPDRLSRLRTSRRCLPLTKDPRPLAPVLASPLINERIEVELYPVVIEPISAMAQQGTNAVSGCNTSPAARPQAYRIWSGVFRPSSSLAMSPQLRPCRRRAIASTEKHQRCPLPHTHYHTHYHTLSHTLSHYHTITHTHTQNHTGAHTAPGPFAPPITRERSLSSQIPRRE